MSFRAPSSTLCGACWFWVIILPPWGPSCKLRLSRFSAELKFQDGPNVAIKCISCHVSDSSYSWNKLVLCKYIQVLLKIWSLNRIFLIFTIPTKWSAELHWNTEPGLTLWGNISSELKPIMIIKLYTYTTNTSKKATSHLMATKPNLGSPQK